MKTLLRHRQTPTSRRRDPNQLRLTLEPAQLSESIPSASRAKCLRLWRDLLLWVVLHEKPENGGSHER
ncbi:MAG: hypothetical protein ABSG59_24950 [Verrucomicrobiota bacterium]